MAAMHTMINPDRVIKFGASQDGNIFSTLIKNKNI
jgi:hypothetical protein